MRLAGVQEITHIKATAARSLGLMAAPYSKQKS
jgi:hypothetical protein